MKNEKVNREALRIAIQGYEGSFHQVAAQYYFGKNIEEIPCASFRELIKITSDKRSSNAAVMAIENSIAGSILSNYALLQKTKLCITGEIYLKIRQNLLVNKSVKLDDIKEVHSHPMALQQCHEFLDQYNWKLVETEDTALSAKHIHQHRSKHIAAIASSLAAELYDLKVISADVQTQKTNYTRFLVLQREEDVVAIRDANKASLNFHTDHSRGSLAKVLTRIAEGGINLSKLQSFPIAGSDFKYSFHVDMEFDSTEQFVKTIDNIRPLTQGLKIFGTYKKGLWK